MLIDMVNVKYLSSMGLGVIISLMNKSKAGGSDLFLYDTQVSVKQVLRISRLDFLELKPEAVNASNPFYAYILDEEPKRRKLRESREEEKKKQEVEPASKRKLTEEKTR